jgi:predicted RNA binding protein YcfA (HicA-like mRNA interferase family)
LNALQHIGWKVKRQTGSHKILERSGWSDVVFAFHDNEEIGPKMLTRVAKVTGLKLEDL